MISNTHTDENRGLTHSPIIQTALGNLTGCDTPSFAGPGYATDFGETDPVTGLPFWDDATESLRACIAGGRRFHAVAFVLQSIHSINVRYGSELGDRVLQAFRDHIARSLPASSVLFRGTGPTLVALVPNAQLTERMRMETRKIAASMGGQTFETGDREVMIAIAANWTVVPVEGSVAHVKEQIDASLAGQRAVHAGSLRRAAVIGRA